MKTTTMAGTRTHLQTCSESFNCSGGMVFCHHSPKLTRVLLTLVPHGSGLHVEQQQAGC